MQYRGVTSDKRKLLLLLESLYQKANSEKAFYRSIQKEGYELYERRGQVVGIISNRKYRLKTLGYTQELIKQLFKKLTKSKRLEAIRKIRERNMKSRERGGREL